MLTKTPNTASHIGEYSTLVDPEVPNSAATRYVHEFHGLSGVFKPILFKDAEPRVIVLT